MNRFSAFQMATPEAQTEQKTYKGRKETNSNICAKKQGPVWKIDEVMTLPLGVSRNLSS